ncbi:alpha/beta hydrolase [Gordonia neofelifaecis]|uniref:Putative esterase n=1 Tax=Gordonia neofelifaecis NRRL B-59395 TaxID=644548 RepID=F1YP70_9ACTN|nr:alpha/beta hydrolase family protein [Gordonia neofelifaecis]EGD53465.1 putative esterase [Gordonia neofelifaecis NRRL B-59395]
MWSNRLSLKLATALSVVGAAGMLASVSCAPVDAAPKGARIVSENVRSIHRVDLMVKSAAMKGAVPVTVLSPGGTAPRPTVYMLDGAGAGDEVSDWITKGGAETFFAGRDVNVVLPAGGAGSFYTNWENKDKKLGKPQWETFLVDELPGVIDSKFYGSGNNAVMGLSMGGQSAFALATRHPKLYRGVASMSGCPPVSGQANEAYVRATVAQSGANADNMWGPAGSKEWLAHDPSRNVDALRGKALYISSGSGAVGPLDITTKRDPKDGPEDAQIAAGSALEVGANRCSLEFAALLRAKGVPFTSGFRLIGTHSWEYWKQDLPEAWAAISPAL